MVQRLGFLGVRTTSAAAFDSTVALYRDVLAMAPFHDEPDAVWFRAADGTEIHVYGPAISITSSSGPGRSPGLWSTTSTRRAGDGRGGHCIHRRPATGRRLGLEPLPGSTATSTRSWAGTLPVADDALTAPGLLRSVGFAGHGPAVWGRQFAASGPGVFVIEPPSPPATRANRAHPRREVDGTGPDAAHGRRTCRVAGRGRPASRHSQFRRRACCTSGAAPPVFRRGSRRSTRRHWANGGRPPVATGSSSSTGLERARVWWARRHECHRGVRGRPVRGVRRGRAGRGSGPGSTTRPSCCRSPTSVRRPATARPTACPAISSPTMLRRLAKMSPHVRDLPPGDAEGATGLPPTRAAGGTTRRAPRPKAPASPAPSRCARRRHGAPLHYARSRTPRTYPRKGITRLRDELAELTTVRRPEVIGRIKSAKELGDLKENADYTAAREEQSFLEGRVATIEGLLRAAVVIEASGPDGRVHVGSSVSVEEVGGDGSVAVYRIVGSAEADPAAGRISNASPVGRALIGRSVGETVSVATPRGRPSPTGSSRSSSGTPAAGRDDAPAVTPGHRALAGCPVSGIWDRRREFPKICVAVCGDRVVDAAAVGAVS